LQADSSSHAIRRIIVSSAEVTTIANAATRVGCADGAGRASADGGRTDGTGRTLALFNSPSGIAMDAAKTFAIIVRL
jgi:hypothetical protein